MYRIDRRSSYDDWGSLSKQAASSNFLYSKAEFGHAPALSDSMNEQILLGNWKQFKGNIKAKWGKLTEDDLEFADGRREQLIGKLQERYGILKDEAERQMNAFEDFNKTALKSS